jgi:hypothetical protein
VALLSALTGCGSGAHRLLEETFEQTYRIEPTANITLTNGDGAVFVYGSNASEMRVQAIKRAYTRERLKQIAVNVSIQPGSVSINTKFPPKPKWALFDRSGTVDYTVVVPATVSLARLELGGRWMHAWGAGESLLTTASAMSRLRWIAARSSSVTIGGSRENLQFKQILGTEIRGPSFQLTLFVIWLQKQDTEKLETISRSQPSVEPKRSQRPAC